MNDLHERMKAAGGGLPPTPFTIDDVARAGRRRVRRRQWLLGSSGAAAAVVAVVAAATALSGTRAPSPSPGTVAPPAAAPEASFAVTFKGFRAGEYRVADPSLVTPGYVTAGVWHDSDHIGMLTAYRTGVFRPPSGESSAAFSNEQVLGVRTGSDRAGPLAWKSLAVRGAAWRIAPDTWVTLETFGDEGTLRPSGLNHIMVAFRPASGGPARLPYTVGHLPPGYDLVQAGTYGRVANANDAVVTGSAYQRDAPAFAGMTGIVEFESPASTALLITMVKRDEPLGAKCRPATTASGVMCAKATPDGLRIEVDDRSRTLPEAEVAKILDSVRPVEAGDTEAWVPVGR